MERIEDLARGETQADYGPLGWLPALSLQYRREYALWPHRIRDAWAVLMCRATAVQWPEQRTPEAP